MKKAFFVLLVLLGVTVVVFMKQNQAEEEDRLILEEDKMKIEVVIHNQVLEGVLENTDSARAFYQMLPLSLTMNELNGNEKYYYFSEDLPTQAYVPSVIQTGDLMLYGSDCLVLFYDSFQTSYRYTRLGKVNGEVAGLVGDGRVEVLFRIKE